MTQRSGWLVLAASFILGALLLEPIGDFVFEVYKNLFGDLAVDTAKFLKTHRFWVLLAVGGVLMLALYGQHQQRRGRRQEEQERLQRQEAEEQHQVIQERARQQQEFALLRPASTLRPEDMSFLPLDPGVRSNPEDNRPLYPVYIRRQAVPHDRIAARNPQPVYDEAALAQALRDGRSVLFLGQPLEGKSRVVYDIVKRLHEFFVLRPDKQKSVPTDEAFAILAGQRVVLMLDDLNEYTRAPLDLREFCDKLRHHTSRTAIVATCRDGPELAAMQQQGLYTPLRRFYEQMTLKLRFLPPTDADKESLARGSGKEWFPARSWKFPTLGSITMEESLEAMRQRFANDLDPYQRDVLKAIKLLVSSGIDATQARLQAILTHLLRRPPLPLQDCLDTLTEYAFLRRPAHQDPVQPELAYLLGAVTSPEGNSPEADCVPLIALFSQMADADGLLSLGNTFWTRTRYRQALDCYEQALSLYKRLVAEEGRQELANDLAIVLMNRGNALVNLGRLDEALAAYDEAIRITQRLIAEEGRQELANDLARALMNRGVALANLGRLDEALAAYDEAIRITQRLIAEEGRQELANDLARALTNKALLLEQRAQWSEVFLCYDQAISWQETCLRADMSHVLPELLRTVRYAMMTLLDRQQWEEAAAQVRRVLPWVLPALQAGTLPAPLLREWEQFVGQLRALSQEALEQVYTALGEQAEQVRGLLATPGAG